MEVCRMKKIMNIRKKIQGFAKKKTPKDLDYQKHLAICSRLYELDKELSVLENEEPESLEETEDRNQRIAEIGEEVMNLVSSK